MSHSSNKKILSIHKTTTYEPPAVPKQDDVASRGGVFRKLTNAAAATALLAPLFGACDSGQMGPPPMMPDWEDEPIFDVGQELPTDAVSDLEDALEELDGTEVAPDAIDPDVADPDAIDPDAADPDAIDPDVADPDAIDPDLVDPDATDPDVAQDVPTDGASDLDD